MALLSGKTAIIHGGAGAIGSAIARAFAREGASVFLTGRTRARVEALAKELNGHASSIDALDEAAVEAHAREVGAIDIMVNAIGVPHVQGVGLAELSLDDFMLPVNAYVRSTFLTARAAGRVMAKRKTGVILSLSVPGSRLAGRGFLGNGVAFAAVEAMTRLLAAELGPDGVRVACICPHAIPEALARGSHSRRVFDEELLATRMAPSTLLGRLPTLSNVAETATFLASSHASAITGAIVNLTCGTLVDH